MIGLWERQQSVCHGYNPAVRDQGHLPTEAAMVEHEGDADEGSAH